MPQQYTHYGNSIMIVLTSQNTFYRMSVRRYRKDAGRHLHGQMAESAEGGRLLSDYTVLNCIAGSNPALSAIHKSSPR